MDLFCRRWNQLHSAPPVLTMPLIKQRPPPCPLDLSSGLRRRRFGPNCPFLCLSAEVSSDRSPRRRSISGLGSSDKSVAVDNPSSSPFKVPVSPDTSVHCVSGRMELGLLHLLHLWVVSCQQHHQMSCDAGAYGLSLMSRPSQTGCPVSPTQSDYCSNQITGVRLLQ